MMTSKAWMGTAIVAVSTMVSGGAAVADPTAGAAVPQVAVEVPVAGATVGGVIVPGDARAAVVNVTATNPVAQGYLTVHPCLDELPPTSNVNFVAGRDVATTAVVRLSSEGSICVSTSVPTDVIVDLQGYVPAGSDLVLLDTPRRAVDTRNGIGAPAAAVEPGATLTLPVAAIDGVPSDATGLVATATATESAAAGFLTVQGCGADASPSSTLNLAPGRAVPNLVLAPVTNGATCLTPDAATDLVVDVAGYLPAGADGIVVLPSPSRLVDTRVGLGTSAAPLREQPQRLRLAGLGTVPADATAVVVNLTATRATAAGFVTVAPCGGPSAVSNLNVQAGSDVANAALLPVGADGTVCASASAPLDLLVDVTAYVTDDDIVPVTPTRLYDSRTTVPPQCGLALVHPAPTLLWVVDVATGAIVQEITDERFDGVGFLRETLLHAELLPSCDGLLVWNPVAYAPPNLPPNHRFELLAVPFGGALEVLGEVGADEPVLAFPDGVIAVPALDGFADARRGEPVVRLPDGHVVRDVLPDGRIVTVGDDGRVRLFVRRAASDPLYPDAEPVDDAVTFHGELSPSGRFQVVRDGDGTFRVVTTDHSTVAALSPADVSSDAALFSAEWYADGLLIVCGSHDEPQPDGSAGRVWQNHLWNVFTGELASWPLTACVVDAR